MKLPIFLGALPLSAVPVLSQVDRGGVEVIR